MTTIFSKYFQIPNTIIALISSAFGAVSKLLYVKLFFLLETLDWNETVPIFQIIVSTTFMLYVARTFDMFTESNNVAARCILSAIVDQNEVGEHSVASLLTCNFLINFV